MEGSQGDPGAAVAGADVDRGLGALRLFELQDSRLQAVVFLVAWGSSVVLYGTVINRSANADHVLAGFLMFTTGAALAILTLGGARRAAARLEEVLRIFF